MTRLPAAQRSRSLWPELMDIFDGFPAWANLRASLGANLIRIEDDLRDGTYELRAEIPGVDPDKDVEITVRDGVLTIKAERSEEKSNGRSEFSYGSFMRSVTLPMGADEDAIKATYDKGILTVSVPVNETAAEESGKRIKVEVAK